MQKKLEELQVYSLILNSHLFYFSGNNENAATSLNGAISEDLQLPSTPSSTATPSSGGAGILTLPPGKKKSVLGFQAEHLSQIVLWINIYYYRRSFVLSVGHLFLKCS